VVLVDDCWVRPVECECDVVLNYNLNADALGYEKGHAELLLGSEFVLLRSEFWSLTPE
jgi:spore coat polysaccharide biosynthesis predicted glycosyltransferase SpsG